MRGKLFFVVFFMLSPVFQRDAEAALCKEPLLPEEKPVLLLYYLPWCPYSEEVFSFLRKNRKTISSENLQKNPEGRKQLEKIGGKMQVPCLIVNDCALYESGAIIRWLSNHKEYLDDEG